MEIFRVNDWVVTTKENDENTKHIRNSRFGCFCDFANGRYFNFHPSVFRVPKTIQKVLGSYVRGEREVSQRRFGVEIECFHPTNSNIKHDLVQALSRKGISCSIYGYTHNVTSSWKITTDSSITGAHSMEIVSPPMRGEDGLIQLKTVLETASQLGCKVNKSCGLHIHHEAVGLSSVAIRNLFDFYKNNESVFDSLMPQSRRADNNIYCHTLTTFERWKQDRYFKVNYRSYIKYNTIEFRQHSGTLSYEKVYHWFRLTQAVIEEAGNYRGNRYNLTDMLSWLGLNSLSSWFSERREELAYGI